MFWSTWNWSKVCHGEGISPLSMHGEELQVTVIGQVNMVTGLLKEEGTALYELAGMVATENIKIVEVGSWKGFSTIFLGRVASECEGYVFCVDHWKGNEGTDNVQEAQTQDVQKVFEHNMKTLGLWAFIKPMAMDSLVACKSFEDNSVDLVFLDADHRYDNFKADLIGWYPKVKVGGIICGHDCEGYYSLHTAKGKEVIDQNLAVDYCPSSERHSGIIKALYDYFNDDYSIAEGTKIWFKVK